MGKAIQDCPTKPGNLLIKVRRQKRKSGWEKLQNNCEVRVHGNGYDQTKNLNDKVMFSSLEPGTYTIDLKPAKEEATYEIEEQVEKKGGPLQPNKSVGTGNVSSSSVIESGKTNVHYFSFFPCELIVQVKSKNAAGQILELLKDVTVKVKEGDPLKGKSAVTDGQGRADFGLVPAKKNFTLEVALTDEQKRKYVPEAEYKNAPAKRFNKEPFLVLLGLRRIYVQLYYKDPDEVVRPFPKDFPVNVAFSDPGSAQTPTKVSDDKGTLDFEIIPEKKKFTLKTGDANDRYLVHKPKNNAWVPDDKPLLVNPNDDALRKLTLNNKRFFLIPRTWSLTVCEWKSEKMPAVTKGLHDMPAEGQCTKGSPGKLTLLPKCQYVRFEYYDRKYYHSNHGNKRVSIPPIVLKGARKADANGAPVAPGIYDTVSNCVVDGSDITKMRQVLPWVIVKNASGDPLPNLDNKMLLEFGWPKGYVCAEDPSDVGKRKIAEIGSNDPRLAINVSRSKYYDLPTLWKSINYYTRFSDPAKNLFFDDLAAGDITPSFSKATPLIFSLDDIVLMAAGNPKVVGASNQKLKDKDATDTAKALSADSRVAILYLDPDKDFKMKVFNPDPKVTEGGIDYGYHSKNGFAKDKANRYRNVIVEHPPWIRAVMFCSGFYDVYNKRTENPKFADKELAGARAAVLDDTDITYHSPIVADRSWGDYAAEGCGNFVFYALQYAGVDDTNADKTKHRVVFALVTYWNCRLKTNGLTAAADVTNARDKGMPNSMARWNVKNYEFHVTGRTDILGRTFSLFEAKRDNFDGKHLCMATVVRDALDGGSWMGKDTAHLRESAYKTEPGRLRVSDADYDGNIYECLATAHELGHATGLHDEYVYYLENYSGLIRYNQYYDGMPYVPDDWSLMKNNEALRLRHYWGKAAWVNANMANIPGLNAGDKDKIEVFFPAKNLHYTRPAGETLKDVYTPKHTQNSVPWTGGGSVNFHLYRLGDEEFMYKLKGQPYKGILVIATKISARFKQGGLKAWATGKAYKAADLVTNAGKTYYCLADHASGAAFAGDAAKWKEVVDKADWAAGTAYAVADMVREGGSYWYCKTAHTSASITNDIAKWPWICTNKGAWAAGTNYSNMDIVANGGAKYVCNGAHTATTFAADSAKWVKVNDKGAWLPSTPYARLDLVTSSAGLRLCKDAHTSAGRKTHNANWTQGAKGQSWSDAKKQGWIGSLNSDLNAMLGGKFRLACTTANEFSKSYIHVFPQYEVVAVGVAASAGTNYELEITRDGSASFNGAGNTIRAGENCNNNKIIRHMYSKCDGGTTALIKTDLAEVATWVGGKAGGTFNVETT